MTSTVWQRTLVVIPALDEAATLPEVIAGVRRYAVGADVLVVDDGSRDRTGALARALGCEVLRHPFNLGHGAALQSGFRWAAERGYAFVIHLDGDGQHDPAGLPALLDTVASGEVDVALGSRFLARDGMYRMSPLRRGTVSFFGALVRLITGLRVTDPTSGFQALNREAFTFHLGDHFPADFPDADVLVMTHRAGFRIREVPVRMWPHPSGRTMHRGFLKLYYVFKQLVSLGIVVVSGGPARPASRFEPRTDPAEAAVGEPTRDSWSSGPSSVRRTA